MRNNIPHANEAEKTGHELFGHVWAEMVGGQPVRGSGSQNKQSAVQSENEVRRTDSARGQKTKHDQ
jgi:hypothetical protein